MGAMPTLAVGMLITRGNGHMPTASVGMAPVPGAFRNRNYFLSLSSHAFFFDFSSRSV